MIFGNSKSYLVNGVTAVALNKSVTSINMLQSVDIEHVSILTGTKTHSFNGDYADFTVTERLWQESDPKAKFQAIMNCVGQNVTFYLCGTTVFANCYVNYIKPFYLNNLRNYDACIIFLHPISYVFFNRYILDDSGLPVLDDGGNRILSDGLIVL